MKVRRRVLWAIGAMVVLSAFGILVGCRDSAAAVAAQPARARFRVATTTSLYDTGLWGYIEPGFEKEYGVEMDIMYAGTGKALEFGRRGDVDAVTVHSRSSEEEFIAAGYGVERQPFAYNYFLVVGPESDPAGIKGLSPEDGFRQLTVVGAADPGQVKFVSRGDGSGTHSKEKAIWTEAGQRYEDVRGSRDWYVESGAGMGPTLVMANEKSAYALTDSGTYLAFKQDLDLVPVIEQGEVLLNVYSVIAVDAGNAPGADAEMADNLVRYLMSDEIQELIGKYGVEEYGRQLFAPCAGASVCSR